MVAGRRPRRPRLAHGLSPDVAREGVERRILLHGLRQGIARTVRPDDRSALRRRCKAPALGLEHGGGDEEEEKTDETKKRSIEDLAREKGKARTPTGSHSRSCNSSQGLASRRRRELKEMAAAPYQKTQQQRSARTFKRGLHASLEIRPRRCDRSGAGGWVGETHLRPLLASESRQAGQRETLSSLVTWRGETTRFQAGGPVAAIPSSQSARLSVGRSETSEARPRSRGRRSDLLVTPSGALLSSDAIWPGGGSTIGACVDGTQRAWWWRWGELGRRGQSRMTCRRLTRAWELLHGVAYLLSTKGGIFKLSRRRGSSKSLDERNARGWWDKL